MAVSFSTGGSGYTRSDYMISDAALPARIEEAVQADQKDRFSKVLSGIGEAKNAVQDTQTSVSDKPVTQDSQAKLEKLQKEFASNDGGIDMHKLVKAVADGEVSLDEIPQELFTDEMLRELVKLVSPVKPEQDSKKSDASPDEEPAVQQLTAELAAMFTQTVTPDDVNDVSEEMSKLAGRAVQAVQDTAEMPENVQQAAQEAAPQQTEEAPAEAADEAVKFTVEVPEEVQPQAEAKPAQSKVQDVQPEHGAEQTAAPEAAKPTENAEAQNGEGQAESGQSYQQDGAQTARTDSTAVQAGADIRSDISRVEVKTNAGTDRADDSEQPKAEQAEQEAPVFGEHSAQRSRVVSKSDELDMIRSSGSDKTADEAPAQAMAQPQAAPAERPVVFTRHDGGEVTVRPSDVAKQVAEKLVERTEELREGEVEYSVTLTPEDLGRITVKMTKTADGAVSVSIAAENSRTMKMIEDNGSAIQDSLKQNGVQLENWQTVSESRQDAQAQDYQGSSKNPYRESSEHRQENDPDEESFAEIIASM